MYPTLISADVLREHVGRPDWVVLDARFRLDDPEATTVIIHEDRSAGDGTEFILLARNVQLTSDRTGIARISADGWVVFREQGPVSRRVRITQSATGELRHEWSGHFDGIDREAWLQRMFTHFADHTRPNRRW